MIEELHIQNFALIDDWSIEFGEGETVVTGETGSGKSLFVESLSYLLGSNLDRSVIRDPDKDLLAEGVFFIDKGSEDLNKILADEGIELEEGRLIIKRWTGLKGSRQKINDRSVTKKFLESISENLMTIHAQNAQSILTKRDSYGDLLDLYLGQRAEDLKKDLKKLLDNERNIQASLDELELEPDEIERERDLLTYQIDEINRADLEDLDEDDLNKEYKGLQSAIERLEESGQALQVLSGRDYSIRGAVNSLAQALDRLCEKNNLMGLQADDNLEKARDLAWQVEGETALVLEELEAYRSSIIIDPERIDEIDDIFKTIQSLKRKYGSSFKEILEFRDRATEKLEKLNHLNEIRDGLLEQAEQNKFKMQKSADDLSRLRKEAARSFESRIEEELKDMAIKHISFSVNFEEVKIGPKGQDRIDFLISTNEGEKAQSLSLVASGGEMSRFMLAFTILCSEIGRQGSLIFDEIDSGISGRTAQKVSEKMAGLSHKRQLIVISHLPQIAAMADRHMKIHKEVLGGKSYSRINELDRTGRIEEQARLIGGAKLTDITRKSAEQMLDQAQAIKDQFSKK